MKKQSKRHLQTKERYHGPLITQGVHLAYIKSAPFLGLLLTVLTLVFAVFNKGPQPVQILFWSSLFINIFSILFSLFNRIILRFQIFTYFLIMLNMLTILIDIDFLSLMMFAGAGQNYSKLSSLPAIIYSIALLILFIVMVFVYAYFYSRNRLTNGAYREKEKKFNSWDNKGLKKFWITLAAVTIIPPLLTGHLVNAFGFVLGVAVTATFTAVVVDCFYAAAYVRKHLELEED